MKIKYHFTKLFIILLWLMIGCSSATEVTPESALKSYLENTDDSFSWEIHDHHRDGNIQLYNIKLVSQNWRDHSWSHQVSIFVPDEIAFDGALLFISGGSNSEGIPNWKKADDSSLKLMQLIADNNKALVAVLFQTPNQPLYDNLTEDELISFTFHNYRNDKDYSWPLLFPMVKSAIKAMDAVQEFSKETLDHKISRFMVSGASKRGWTTWLTGAHDSRVEAIAPMVIDMLNMPESISYHLEAWGSYSIQIQDYVDLGIAQDVDTPDGQELVAMVDPYSYRKQLEMPKLIINGTNDEYWPADAIKHYIDEIPGKNYLHYVPNAGHSLGDKKQAIQALNAFFGSTLRKEEFPDYRWTVEEGEEEVVINIDSDGNKPAGIKLWISDSSDRDFRNDSFNSDNIPYTNTDTAVVRIAYPQKGFRAFYVELIYIDHNGEPYTLSTRMYVTDTENIL